jgi:DNA polymerase-3 subunit epsilon
MMTDFVCLDFETANRGNARPCELGITIVKDGQIKDTHTWLIKPNPCDFDYFNILLHGISQETVMDAPEFPEIWAEAVPYLQGQFVIAHNAGFDVGVLRRALGQYRIPFPTLDYACSYIFSKKVWPGLPSYGLNELCAHNGIQFRHHRAGPDSRATAELALMAFKLTGVSSKEQFKDSLRTSLGSLYPGGYEPCRTISNRKSTWNYDLSKVVGDPSKHKPESIFFGRCVVVTGVLGSITRNEAAQVIADIGGINGTSVTKKTDFLIVGQQDYRIVGEDGMSKKQEKAMAMKAAGAEIEILSEVDFLKNI